MSNPTFLPPFPSISSYFMAQLEDLGLACASKLYQERSFKGRVIAVLGLGVTINAMAVNCSLVARYESIAWVALALLSIPFKPVVPQLADYFFEKLSSSAFTYVRYPYFLLQVAAMFISGKKIEKIPTTTTAIRESQLRLSLDMFLSEFPSLFYGKLRYEIRNPQELRVVNIFLRKNAIVEQGVEHRAATSVLEPKSVIRKRLFDLTPTGAGAIFLKEDILSDLTDNGKTQKMCTDGIDVSDRNIEIFTFVLYKTVFIYVYGKRSEEPLPNFFSENLRSDVEELRKDKEKYLASMGAVEVLNAIVSRLTPTVASAVTWHNFYEENEKMLLLIEVAKQAKKLNMDLSVFGSDLSPYLGNMENLDIQCQWIRVIQRTFNQLRETATNNLKGNMLLIHCWPIAFAIESVSR